MFGPIIDEKYRAKQALIEQALASPGAPEGPPEAQALNSRGFFGQLGARLGIGEPLTDFERESSARARAHGLGFLGTGLGATKAVQFALDDRAQREYEESEQERVRQLLAQSTTQQNLARIQNDRYARTNTGVFDRQTGQFLTNDDYIQLQADERAAQSRGGNEVVGAQQFTDNDGNLYSVSTAKNGGGLVIADGSGRRLNQLPEGAVPISDAGIAEANKRSVEAFDDFSNRSVNAATRIAKNEDTIRLIDENAGAFGSQGNDVLGRLMTQTLGIEYAGLDHTDFSTLSARFAESQLQTVQDYLAGTGPVTEAEQAIAARFSGSFDLSATSTRQIFELQNYLAKKDQRMRQDWAAAGLPEREFTRWRNRWVEENEDLDELQSILNPSETTQTTTTDEFQQAGRFRYRIRQ